LAEGYNAALKRVKVCLEEHTSDAKNLRDELLLRFENILRSFPSLQADFLSIDLEQARLYYSE
jgi:hypothetical protein